MEERFTYDPLDRLTGVIEGIDTTGAFAVLDSHVLSVGKALYYVHPDHLGSWTTVTDRVGAVVQDVRFDPWGTPYYSDSTHLVQATSLLFERGFTGHEHLMRYGLINMNGRVYDPVTSTFLSVDNYVQDPSSTQNFNRYAYCLNNPLKYTDPDGEFFITFGLSFDKEHGLTGFSLGINFGFFGFGINTTWGNGLSLGVYGELGPRIGNIGATTSAGINFNFNYATTSLNVGAGLGVSSGLFKAGVNASLSYSIKPSGYGYEGYGASAGIGIGDDYMGGLFGVSYSRSNGKGNWSYGLAGYYDIPKVYNFNTHDNYQNKSDYCAPGTLEEVSRSLGIDMHADVWAMYRQRLQNGPIEAIKINGYYQLISESYFAYEPPSSRQDLIEMVNASGWASAENMYPDINNMISAYNKGQRILATTAYKQGELTKGHVVPVHKLKVYTNEGYKIYFSEVSPKPHVPDYLTHINGIPGQGFRYVIFQLRP